MGPFFSSATENSGKPKGNRESCMVRYGADRYGADRYGADRYGVDRYGVDRYGVDRYGVDRYGVEDAMIGLVAAAATTAAITGLTAPGPVLWYDRPTTDYMSGVP